MPSYDSGQFSPPAAVAQVQLRNPKDGNIQATVSLLLDSGADVTLLPRAAVESIGIELVGSKYELIAFDGTRSEADAVHAELVFLRKTFRGQFLLTDQGVGVLGRDVLNHLCVLLDGPRLLWEEQTPTKG
jgi:hypothetical protein